MQPGKGKSFEAGEQIASAQVREQLIHTFGNLTLGHIALLRYLKADFTQVRNFAVINASSIHGSSTENFNSPSIIMDLSSGKWRGFTLDYPQAVAKLQNDPHRDFQLLDCLEQTNSSAI
jgi:hypothetical protein